MILQEAFRSVNKNQNSYREYFNHYKRKYHNKLRIKKTCSSILGKIMSTLREKLPYIDLKICANDSIKEKNHSHKTYRGNSRLVI